ncbi:MAG TPA: hypothetical protein VG994_19040 [Steroidobacteraceae bacterium]|nr:hypothetical protein [Steroidobacteraceae bacterium]
MAASEHILLESDERQVPHPRCSKKVHAGIELHSRLRRRTLQLQLIDYYFLVVRSYRGRAMVAEYVLDLRFVDATLAWSKHLASRWLLAALALGTLGVAIALRIEGSAAPTGWLIAAAIVSTAAIAAAVVGVYRTTETLSMHSAHGRARLFEFTAGLGVKKAFAPFTRKLAAHIELATRARRRARSEHLRDEMREHFRLREHGVLSAEEYEASKARILAAHEPSDVPDRLTAAERRAARLAPKAEGGWY